MNRSLTIGASLCVFLAAGCGARLNLSETVKLGVEGKVYEIEAIANEQKIKVHVKPASGPVDVFVYLEKQSKEAEGALYGGGKDSMFLARELRKEEVQLEATVPANEKVLVLVRPATGKDPGETSIKITN